MEMCLTRVVHLQNNKILSLVQGSYDTKNVICVLKGTLPTQIIFIFTILITR